MNAQITQATLAAHARALLFRAYHAELASLCEAVRPLRAKADGHGPTPELILALRTRIAASPWVIDPDLARCALLIARFPDSAVADYEGVEIVDTTGLKWHILAFFAIETECLAELGIAPKVSRPALHV